MERKVISEEIRMYKDLPGHFVAELLTQLLWPNQPLGMNIAGETKSVGSISKNQLLTHKQRFYQLNNIVVVACGNLKHSQVLKECQRCIPRSGRTQKNIFVPVVQKQKSLQIKFHVKNTEQTHLALGVHGLPRAHPGRYTLGVLHVILGANMSSRLFREVREKRGLAYEIGTTVKFLQDTGAFVVYAGIDNHRVLEALKVILQQLIKIKKKRVRKDELKRAKEYYIGQLMLALENTSEHMLWLGENFLSLNRFVDPKEIIRCVERVTADDLKELADNILQNQHLNLALIGPLRDKDKRHILKGLNL